MKPQYKKNPVLSYFIRRNFLSMLQPAITAESLSSWTKILVFSEKIANLNRFFEVLIWPLISYLLWDAIGNDVSLD